jgi:hypothetical protein
MALPHRVTTPAGSCHGHVPGALQIHPSLQPCGKYNRFILKRRAQPKGFIGGVSLAAISSRYLQAGLPILSAGHYSMRSQCVQRKMREIAGIWSWPGCHRRGWPGSTGPKWNSSTESTCIRMVLSNCGKCTCCSISARPSSLHNFGRQRHQPTPERRHDPGPYVCIPPPEPNAEYPSHPPRPAGSAASPWPHASPAPTCRSSLPYPSPDRMIPLSACAIVERVRARLASGQCRN